MEKNELVTNNHSSADRSGNTVIRVGSLDVGSNSVRMQVNEISGFANRILFEEKHNLRLGEEVYSSGILTSETIKKLLEVIAGYLAVFEGFSVHKILAVATAALRDAQNSSTVIEEIKTETGLTVEVISGDREAELIFRGVVSGLGSVKNNLLAVDIGGGSCEITAGSADTILGKYSFKLGSTLLTKQFLKNDPPKRAEIKQLVQYTDKTLAEAFQMLKTYKIRQLIVTGGSLNNLTLVQSFLYGRKKGNDRKGMTERELSKLIRILKKKKVQERLKLPGLEARRAEIILAAALVMQRILKLTGIESFTSMPGGLRDGLAAEFIQSAGLEKRLQLQDPQNLEKVLVEFGRRYRFDEAHALTVTAIALKLFDYCCLEFQLDKKERPYLMAAAMLHDIGTYISLFRHHKHSMYLILNSELPGFDENETRIIACTARYHRKSLPEDKHAEFAQLKPNEKKTVERLSAILRVADALDRSHTGRLKNIRLEINRTAVILKSDNSGGFIPEKDALNRKADLFRKVFKHDIILA